MISCVLTPVIMAPLLGRSSQQKLLQVPQCGRCRVLETQGEGRHSGARQLQEDTHRLTAPHGTVNEAEARAVRASLEQEMFDTIKR